MKLPKIFKTLLGKKTKRLGFYMANTHVELVTFLDGINKELIAVIYDGEYYIAYYYYYV